MKKYMKIATATAVDTGNFLAIKYRQKRKISFKGEINLVTDSDLAAERRIIKSLKKAFPSHEIIAEETAGNYHNRKPAKYRWIIDPLDGTTNFAHGYPLFAVSIALEYNGRIILGVAYTPLLKELFTAVTGKGAYLNGKKIRVSKTSRLSQSLLATGFPYDIRQSARTNLNYYGRMQLAGRDIRRDGTAVLNLCYVACGRFDGFWEMKLKPWDTAAGMLILKEAGGKITDFRGKPYSIYGEETLASNKKIHQQMVAVLKKR